MPADPPPLLPRWLTCCLAVLVALASPALAEPQPDTDDYERWHVVLLNDQRVGYLHMYQQFQGDRITTGQTMRMSLRRGPTELAIELDSRFHETVGGEPIEAETQLRLGAAPTRTRVTFDEQGIEVVRIAGDRAQRSRRPAIEGEWMTPAAAQRHVAERLAEGAETIGVRTVDVSSGEPTPVTMTMTLVGHEPVEVYGKVVPATVWDARASIMPTMTAREYVDERGLPLKTTINLMGIELTMLAADEELATAEVDAPELLISTLIEPTGRIERPRQVRSARYRVSLADGGASGEAPSLELPSIGVQRVERDGDDSVVTVHLDRPVPPGDDRPGDEHLAASGALDHEDPKVRELVARALGEEADQLGDAEKAMRLRAFVRDYVQEKDLSVGFATASEVARARQGDCTEHGVLLAAMLRGAGIPSRTVTGLIYVDRFLGREGVFGYHMWTQAWLAGDGEAGAAEDEPPGGRWVDLDATLPERPYDAAHLVLGVSALADGWMHNDLVEMMPVYRRLRIEVLEAE